MNEKVKQAVGLDLLCHGTRPLVCNCTVKPCTTWRRWQYQGAKGHTQDRPRKKKLPSTLSGLFSDGTVKSLPPPKHPPTPQIENFEHRYYHTVFQGRVSPGSEKPSPPFLFFSSANKKEPDLWC